jgi:ER lumen protein retaining receptor
VLPQLLLLRQTTVPTVIDSYYLVCLGSYRAFYILNWITRAADREHHFDPISVIFGVIQTVLYIDFAWVYWTRQRVKLRGGGVVDSDDLRRGWLIGRLVGKHSDLDDLDEEEAPGANGSGSSSNNKRGWGRRGISVSADEGLRGEDAQPLTNPDAFEDLDDDEPGPAAVSDSAVRQEAVGNGSEWVDDEHSK